MGLGVRFDLIHLLDDALGARQGEKVAHSIRIHKFILIGIYVSIFLSDKTYWQVLLKSLSSLASFYY